MASWFLLVLAIVREVFGTISMKLSNGFTRPVFSGALFVFYALSFTALTFALKHIEVSSAYAIWSGLGTALIALIGFIWFKDSLSAVKIISLLLIIAGVVGLNLHVRVP